MIDIPVHFNFNTVVASKKSKKIRKIKTMSGDTFMVNIDITCVKINSSFYFLNKDFLLKNYGKMMGVKKCIGVLNQFTELTIDNTMIIDSAISKSDSFLKNKEDLNIFTNSSKNIKINNFNLRLPSNIIVNIKDENGRKYKLFKLINR